MATAREIRRHMKSVSNIGKITKAMKMVAAARLRRAQDRAAASRPYAIKIREVLGHVVADGKILAGLDVKKHPLLQKREEIKKVAYLVVCSDKGLAGAYSSNVLKLALAEIVKCDKETVIITSGRKAKDFFAHRGYNVIKSHIGFSDRPQFTNAAEIARDAAKRFAEGEFDELYIVYTIFKTALSQVPTLEKVLPVEPPAQDEKSEVGASAEFMFEPSENEILSVLAPKYLETVIYSALVQSAASELGSRMTAMTSATDNAAALVSNLELSYNKARQAGITRELNEIVGGVEALKQAQE
ncbi:MAG: ATP synthase F1 subunit gamma [Phascolarctobacterium sp.]|nr:ATP synthase F1 subunit gamma [Candidatus Phascolarctobacterium caballi]